MTQIKIFDAKTHKDFIKSNSRVSPMEPSLEGATYRDALTGIEFHDVNASALTQQILDAAGIEVPMKYQGEYKIIDPIPNFNGFSNKENLIKMKDAGVLSGNIKFSVDKENNTLNINPTEWDSGLIDLSAYDPKDYAKVNECILRGITEDDYIDIKLQSKKNDTYTVNRGMRSGMVWGTHIDQDGAPPHVQFFRHQHGINDKNYKYNKITGEIYIDPVEPDKRVITRQQPLADNVVRTRVKDQINKHLEAAGLKPISLITLTNQKMEDYKTVEAKKITEETDSKTLKEMHENARKTAKLYETPKEERKGELTEEAVIQRAELKVFDDAIEAQAKLAEKAAAEALKEADRLRVLRMSRDNLTSLLNTRDELKDERVLSDKLKENIVSKHIELTSEKEKVVKIEKEIMEVNEAYDSMEQYYESELGVKDRKINVRDRKIGLQKDLIKDIKKDSLSTLHSTAKKVSKRIKKKEEKKQKAIISELKSGFTKTLSSIKASYKESVEAIKSKFEAVVSIKDKAISLLTKHNTKRKDVSKTRKEQKINVDKLLEENNRLLASLNNDLESKNNDILIKDNNLNEEKAKVKALSIEKQKDETTIKNLSKRTGFIAEYAEAFSKELNKIDPQLAKKVVEEVKQKQALKEEQKNKQEQTNKKGPETPKL
ncbi:hypothetical protein [Pantoea agglomerans]|uniref:hypothetical protein n=1 Tax=Enterobacter agglomerans TaxID=549 RepID=UPI0034CFF799